MSEKVTITKDKLDNLANAVSAKSGEALNLTVDEMIDAVLGIDTGEENILEGVKINGVELPIDNQKKVNIPAVTRSTAGVLTPELMESIDNDFYYLFNKLDDIPTKTSDLTNDSGYITLADLPIYDGTVV